MKRKSKATYAKRKRLAQVAVGFSHSGTKTNGMYLYQAFQDGLNVVSNPNKYSLKEAWADDNLGVLAQNAKDLLITNPVGVYVAAGGSQSARIAQSMTGSISIVFTSAGVVPSPASNVCGIHTPTSEIEANRLGYLKRLAPKMSKLGVLYNSERLDLTLQQTTINNKANSLKLQTPVWMPVDKTNIDKSISDTFDYFVGHVDAVLVVSDPMFHNHRIKAADTRRIPTAYQWREFVDKGGLMSYGVNLASAYKTAGMFAGLLVEQQATPNSLGVISLGLNASELVINLTTAAKLGLIPIESGLLEEADDTVV
jgi:putative ABC transport system substrate-binding protein